MKIVAVFFLNHSFLYLVLMGICLVIFCFIIAYNYYLPFFSFIGNELENLLGHCTMEVEQRLDHDLHWFT